MRVKIGKDWYQVESWGKDNLLTTEGKTFPHLEVLETIGKREFEKKFGKPKNNSQKYPLVVTNLSQVPAILVK